MYLLWGFLFPPPVKDFEAFDTSVCVCVFSCAESTAQVWASVLRMYISNTLSD